MAERDLFAALGEAQPVYATRPTPGAQHELRAHLAMAQALGKPLMPWQQLVARVASERRADDPRQYRYKRIILSTPRQVGKTTLCGNVLTTRALLHERRQAFYTAQTGRDAAARWKDMLSDVQASPALRDYVTPRLAAGSQSMRFPTGSTVSPFAPTAKSLHGYTPDDVMADEVFALDQASGDDLVAAIGPAQMTLRGRQAWYLSTRGDEESLFLDALIEQGIGQLEDDRRTPIDGTDTAFFLWALPAGLDPHNPEHWGFHPALGHTLQLDDMLQLHGQYADSPRTWLRGFMNLQLRGAVSYVLDPDLLERCAGSQTPPASTRDLAVAYECALDRSRSVVWALWQDPVAGVPAARLLLEAPGTDWLPAAIDRLRTDMRPRAIGADDGGPTRDVTDDLRRNYSWAQDERQLQTLGARDLSTACGSADARIRTGELLLDPTAVAEGAGLRSSVENAARRSMGQGWAWDRVKARGPIPDLVALTVGLRLLEHAPAPAPAPMVYVP